MTSTEIRKGFEAARKETEERENIRQRQAAEKRVREEEADKILEARNVFAAIDKTRKDEEDKKAAEIKASLKEAARKHVAAKKKTAKRSNLNTKPKK